MMAALAVLAACATPREQCILDATRDLRVVDRLIAESEGTIERGYAVVEETRISERATYCRLSDGTQYLCWVPYEVRERRAVSVNLDEEARKLRTLQAKRAGLEREARPRVAACQAQFPEG